MDTYEKKYKEALELARVAAFNGHQSLMEGIFPELAESEDEKTRKRIIALVNAHGQGMYKSDMLAWLENIPYTIDHEKREGFHLGYKAALEKQGEKSLTVDIESMIEAYEQRLINQGNGVRNSPIVNMCVAAFKHGVENTLDELHLKQGETSPILSNSSNIGKDEQKPTIEMKSAEESLGIDSETYNEIVNACIFDENKPKFKVGDWVVNKLGNIWHIDSFDAKNYQVTTNKGEHNYFPINIQDRMHLWTIADAKDGDVLYHKAENGIEYIVMNKGLNEHNNIDSYFRYSSINGFGTNIPSVLSAKCDSITPATKEQRDLLFVMNGMLRRKS